MTAPKWTEAFTIGELEAKSPRVLRADGKRIAVFRGGDGELYAVDDRCPHEGYPLAKGELADCVLTCKWHNFKFDIRDGRCLMGDEPVRTFPIRRREDLVEVDVADPPPEVAAQRIWPSLERGMLERKLGQVARDVVRLLDLGVTPAQLSLFVARFDARYAEWGTTHVLPVALDVLAEAERRGEQAQTGAALPLMQAFELASDSHTRRAARPTVAATAPGDDASAAKDKFVALVEAEDGDGAEALLRGGLARGWRRAEIEPWFFETVCAHFLDFGHALIYQIKLFDLLERVDWNDAEELLVAHLRGIVTGTREDTLPEWGFFEAAWASIGGRVAALYERAAQSDKHRSSALTEALISAPRDEALEAVTRALDDGFSLRAVVNAISTAASQRLLRFDITHDATIENQHDWLDVTHTLTFANALRHAIERYRDPTVLRALYFGARFANITRVLDGPSPKAAVSGSADWSRVIELAARRDPDAVGTARRLLEDGEPPVGALWDFVLDDPVVRPIVCAHQIKLLVVALEERRALADDAPLLAAIRVLSSPIRERRVGRVTHEAVRLITEGKVPRTLY